MSPVFGKRNTANCAAFHLCNNFWRGMMIEERDGVTERETVIVERGGGGGVIAAIALLILVLGVLAYFGMLPF